MEHFEKMGVFYLGRPVHMEDRRPLEGYLLYDSRDLVTHGMCVGMTGSGKTGLCIGLLEEAAMDHIPAIIIDPKGDMTNLLLTFPELQPEDFLPWINEEDARRKSLTSAEFAAQQAALWQKGLASWGQDGERIRQMRNSVDFRIYTPGSTAGTQVSILKSFAAPPPVIRNDVEIFQEQVSGAATSLLALLGVRADPVQSREHILISTLLTHYWNQGADVDLPLLIRSIQSPPMSQIGVMGMESFYPSNDRFSFALRLNNLLASPGFSSWMEGVPLDIGRILYAENGRPQHAIFSIAHLNDEERMFFVSLLLNQVLNWTRMQSGTTSLRAILYMDEIFGFFPPVANPPSKRPLLTLLKQARAYGLGIMLTTQNPVDLDYKGLANIGTWFIGRLQTERDKMKVLEGLESAAAQQKGAVTRRDMEKILGSLGNRIFLMNNVHEDEPVLFETRWCMSYLRGPMTREQIRRVTEPVRRTGEAPPLRTDLNLPSASEESADLNVPPVLPPGITQFFAPPARSVDPGATLYHPVLLGIGNVSFADRKKGVTRTEDLLLYTDFPSAHQRPGWDTAQTLDLDPALLTANPPERAHYQSLPEAAAGVKSYGQWQSDLSDWVYRNRTLSVLFCPDLDMISEPDESERDFRIRLQQAAREKRDQEILKLRKKYESRMQTLEDRLHKSRQQVEREAGRTRHQQTQTAIAMGSALLTSVLGRKAVSTTTLNKMATTARSASRIGSNKDSMRRSQENMEIIEQQLADMEQEFRAESDKIADALDPFVIPCENQTIKPTRKDVVIQYTALGWLPYEKDSAGSIRPAW
jgi:hypothetical protein